LSQFVMHVWHAALVVEPPELSCLHPPVTDCSQTES
jgi:hypothetical protein